MPRGISKKVKMRAEEVAHLLRVRGCILTRDAVAVLGVGEVPAEYTLRYLVSAGRAARVLVGQVYMWCYSGESAKKHVARLRRALHEALCRSKVRFATPKKSLKIVANDKTASKLFSRYVRLDVKDTAALHLINGLLELTYGRPAFVLNYGRTPVYIVNCNWKKLPPLRIDAEGMRQREKVTIKVEPELREALERIAAAKGVSMSELALHAVRDLIMRYKATKPYRTVSIKLDAKLRRDLIKAARLMGVSTSELVRRAVERLLERYKTPDARCA